MRFQLLAVIVFASACGEGSPVTQRLDGGFIIGDATEFAPEITSFRATPAMVTAGVPTDVTWSWNFLIDPTFPTPTCTIDNGVGTVVNGQTTSVTLTQVTLFTLTCTNSQGTVNRQTVVGVPPVSPQLSTFTVTPTTIAPNTTQSYTFSWTFANTPSPAPTCYVDGASTSPMTSGMAVSLMLPQARTFRLRCRNGSTAAVTLDATVAVTECGTAAAECNSNASCTDTVTGYTCTCANGYTAAAWVNPPTSSATNSAMGDTCYFQTASPGACDANATHNGSVCQCNAGYVGGGADGDCVRARIAFTTSVVGNGLILNGTGGWTGGSGATGLAWADSICAARATAGSLPGTYKAWLSDATDDAYCRIAGFAGKKSANCGQGALPTQGGPWVRTGDRRPFAPTLAQLAQRVKYYPSIYNELGSAVTATQKVWTATDDAGAYTGNACTDWGNASGGARGTTGLAYGGSTTWTRENNGVNTLDTTCNSTAALVCMEVDAGNGPALPPRHPPTSSKKAFLTSVSGDGALSTWPDAHGISGTYGYQQADEICRSRARYAGYANANGFKAWFSPYASSITNRLFNFSPYYRPDGVVLGTSYSDMFDRQLAASWNMTELNTYVQGNGDAGFAWTGAMDDSGTYYSSSFVCGSSFSVGWTSGSNTYNGVLGKFGMTDERYSGGGFNPSLPYNGPCDTVARLYCVED